MPWAPEEFQYALLRVVPRLERGEAINAGVVLFCRRRGFLAARVRLDRARLAAPPPPAAARAASRPPPGPPPHRPPPPPRRARADRGGRGGRGADRGPPAVGALQLADGAGEHG